MLSGKAVSSKHRDMEQAEALNTRNLQLEALTERLSDVERRMERVKESLRSRGETTQRMSDQLMSSLDEIKGLDEEVAKREEELREVSAEKTALATILAFAKNARESRSDMEADLIEDLGQLAAMVVSLTRKIEETKGYDSDMQRIIRTGRAHAVVEHDSVSRDRICVEFGGTSCDFEIDGSYTFGQLVQQVAIYWALDADSIVLQDSAIEALLPAGDNIWQVMDETAGQLRCRVLNREEQAREVAAKREKLASAMTTEELQAEAAEAAEKAAAAREAEQLSRWEWGGAAGGGGGSGDGGDGAAKAEDFLQRHEPRGIRNTISVRNYVELFLFIAFGVLLVQALFLKRSIADSNKMRVALEGELFDTPFLSPRADGSQVILSQYDSMTVADDFWAWLAGPLRRSAVEEQGRMLRFNHFYGHIQVRQLRVAPGCLIASRFDVFTQPCRGVYSAATRSEQLFGLGNTIRSTEREQQLAVESALALAELEEAQRAAAESEASASRTPATTTTTTTPTATAADDEDDDDAVDPRDAALEEAERRTDAWLEANGTAIPSGFRFWQSQRLREGAVPLLRNLDRVRHVGAVSAYTDESGFRFTLNGANASTYDATLALYKQGGWIDGQTRAVLVNFNIYNPNFDAWAVFDALMEFTPGGGVFPAHVTRMIRVDEQWKSEDQTRLTMEIGCIALTVVALLLSLWDIFERQGLLKYLMNFWNVLEVSIIMLVGVDAFVRYIFVLEVAALDIRFIPGAVESQEYVDLQPLVALYYASTYAEGVLLLCTSVKLFRYFDLNHNLKTVWTMLEHAGGTFGTYIMVFIIFMGAFSFFAHILFGQRLQDYSTLDRTYQALTAMLVGKFNYAELSSVAPLMAPAFFITFLGLGFLVLSNLFLSILNHSFAVVMTRVRSEGYAWMYTEDKWGRMDEEERAAREQRLERLARLRRLKLKKQQDSRKGTAIHEKLASAVTSRMRRSSDDD
eukprot:PLAT5020.1.p1 GENE.PLAT5020.1~~PLAT5020.1.p1  ORF type:complete len:984 (-),score=565.44 PLAT5020.1:86-2998(-)